jgi:hypothetical protein
MSETKFRAYATAGTTPLAEFGDLEDAREWAQRMVNNERAQIRIDELVTGEWKVLEMHSARVPTHRPKD